MTQQYQAFIFDMDGVLLDSEPFWRTAQINVIAQLGHSITVDDCIRNTMGKRIDDIARFWIERFDLRVSVADLSKQILDQTIELISTQASPTDGLNELITFLKNSPLRLGLATSSSQPVIDAVLQRLQLTNVFDVALSADEVVNGKPAPDVYLEVCKRMKVIPERCFSLEDSLTGVKAAVAAGTKTIAFPAHDNNDFTIAFQRVAHLSEVANIVESNMGESE